MLGRTTIKQKGSLVTSVFALEVFCPGVGRKSELISRVEPGCTGRGSGSGKGLIWRQCRQHYRVLNLECWMAKVVNKASNKHVELTKFKQHFCI